MYHLLERDLVNETFILAFKDLRSRANDVDIEDFLLWQKKKKKKFPL